jgi:hypothetical protein
LPGCAGFFFVLAEQTKEKSAMRKVLLLTAVAVTMGVGFSMAGASAAPLTPSALQPALADSNIAEEVRWVRRCRHVWRRSGTRCVRVWRPGRGHYWRWSRRWR